MLKKDFDKYLAIIGGVAVSICSIMFMDAGQSQGLAMACLTGIFGLAGGGIGDR